MGKTYLYSEYRDKIKDGDILFYSCDGSLTSKIVSKWTKSEYTHVGMAYTIGNRVFVIESYPGVGVRMVPMSLRIPHTVVSMGFVWNDNADVVAMNNMMKPYGWLDLVKAAFGWKIFSSKGFICTEYVVDIAKTLGFVFKEDKLRPIDLYQELKEREFSETELT